MTEKRTAAHKRRAAHRRGVPHGKTAPAPAQETGADRPGAAQHPEAPDARIARHEGSRHDDPGSASRAQLEHSARRMLHRPAARIGEIRHGKG